MTDWNLMTEYLQAAMQALEGAYVAGEELRAHPTAERFRGFRSEMNELSTCLAELQSVLADEGALPADELGDWLATFFAGQAMQTRIPSRLQHAAGC